MKHETIGVIWGHMPPFIISYVDRLYNGAGKGQVSLM